MPAALPLGTGAPGTAPSAFEALLEQLWEAHQREVVELRRANEALYAQVKQGRLLRMSSRGSVTADLSPTAAKRGSLRISGSSSKEARPGVIRANSRSTIEMPPEAVAEAGPGRPRLSGEPPTDAPPAAAADGGGDPAREAQTAAAHPSHASHGRRRVTDPAPQTPAVPTQPQPQPPGMRPAQPLKPQGSVDFCDEVDSDSGGVEMGSSAATQSQQITDEAESSGTNSRKGVHRLKRSVSRGLAGVSTKFEWTGRSVFEDLEPKHVDFAMLCVEKHPSREWKELTVREQVSLIRQALKPKNKLISPHGQFMKWWDCVISVALLFVGIVTPYDVVFLGDDSMGFFVVNRLFDLIFVLDIILQFFVQVEIQRPHRGGIMMLRDRTQLRLRYLKSWFLVDVVSVFPFDILSLVLATSSPVLRRAKILRCVKLMKLAKLLRMLRTSRIIQRWRNTIALQFTTQKLLKFCVMISLVCHWMACVWGLSGLTFGAELCDENGRAIDFGEAGVDVSEVSWVTTLYQGGKNTPDNPCNHFAVYAASLHWAVLTLTSIGYGDIVPMRLEEYLVCILCMLAGSVLWAYVIGSLCNIMSNGSQVDKCFEANTDLLNVAMEEARVPRGERPQYREYLREAKAFDRRLRFCQIAKSLSPMLRKHLLYHVTKASLTSVYYFHDQDATSALLMDVASCLAPMFFSRGEPMDGLRHCLCMMDRGTVAHGGVVLVPPNAFQEDFIVTEEKFRSVTKTVSLTYSQVSVLTKEDLGEVLKSHPKYAKKIQRWAVKLAFCRAMVMTVTAYRSSKLVRPMTLSEAFDAATAEGAAPVQRSFRAII